MSDQQFGEERTLERFDVIIMYTAGALQGLLASGAPYEKSEDRKFLGKRAAMIAIETVDALHDELQRDHKKRLAAAQSKKG